MNEVIDAEHETKTMATVPQRSTALMSVDDVLTRLGTIQDLMKRAMLHDIDYGIIPGTNSKPTLLKPGAEKLAVMFRLAPKFRTTKHFHADGHMTVESTCEIIDNAGNFMGECSSMCSSRESKYAWRRSERKCPSCGKAAIIKGKAEYGGGWLCWKKKDGCGKTFADNDPVISSQSTGRVPNEDIADTFNTVLRIAEKRAFLGAIRLVTGSSALFDEEIPNENERDDMPHYEPPAQEQRKPEPPKQDLPDGAILSEWVERLDPNTVNLDKLNAMLPLLKEIQHGPTRKAAWSMVQKFATDNNCAWDDSSKKFHGTEPPKTNADDPIPY